MKEQTRFGFRIATWNELDTLRDIIELSIRGLQKNDYTASQIEGALGHALGLDTQLVKDGTYFVAFPAADPEQIAGCGAGAFVRPSWEAITAQTVRANCSILRLMQPRSEPSLSIRSGPGRDLEP